MDEPPIIRKPNSERQDSERPASGATPAGPQASGLPASGLPASSEPVNPFAATVVQPYSDEAYGGSIPARYWVVLIAAFVLFGGGSYFLPGLGIPSFVALIAAAIRVPLLQRRLHARKPGRQQPPALSLLLTSWIFMLMTGFASLIAFAIVCLPAGLLMFSASGEDEAMIILVFSICGLIGFAVFVFLFYASLRLPV